MTTTTTTTMTTTTDSTERTTTTTSPSTDDDVRSTTITRVRTPSYSLDVDAASLVADFTSCRNRWERRSLEFTPFGLSPASQARRGGFVRRSFLKSHDRKSVQVERELLRRVPDTVADLLTGGESSLSGLGETMETRPSRKTERRRPPLDGPLYPSVKDDLLAPLLSTPLYPSVRRWLDVDRTANERRRRRPSCVGPLYPSVRTTLMSDLFDTPLYPTVWATLFVELDDDDSSEPTEEEEEEEEEEVLWPPVNVVVSPPDESSPDVVELTLPSTPARVRFDDDDDVNSLFVHANNEVHPIVRADADDIFKHEFVDDGLPLPVEVETTTTKATIEADKDDEKRTVDTTVDDDDDHDDDPARVLSGLNNPASFLADDLHWRGSALPNPDAIRCAGTILARTSLRSLLMRRWKRVVWVAYDGGDADGPTELLLFRDATDLRAWSTDASLDDKQRDALVRTRVDFLGELRRPSVRGFRLTPTKAKVYERGGPLLHNFKLERWTELDRSVAAAFASEHEEEVDALRRVVEDCLARCPHGGLKNIRDLVVERDPRRVVASPARRRPTTTTEKTRTARGLLSPPRRRPTTERRTVRDFLSPPRRRPTTDADRATGDGGAKSPSRTRSLFRS